MHLRKLAILLLLAPLVLAGCAGSQEQAASLEDKLASKGYILGEQLSDIRGWRLNGWIYVDDEHFIMRSGVRDHYLVTLKTPCFDLKSAISLSFTTTAASLTDKDRVAIYSRPTGGREIYLIESLHRLSKVASSTGEA